MSSPVAATRPSEALSVLRWMGSKKRLAAQIVSNFPDLVTGRTYYEPFFGGGSVFFAYGVQSAVISDANRDLMNAWRWVRDEPSEVWKALSQLESHSDAYYEMRQRPTTAVGSLAEAVRFLYLNRYCFNGIYRTNRRGEFNVPFGRNTGGVPDAAAFEACSAALAAAEISTGDFGELVSTASEDDVVYFDPPWQSTRATYGEYGYSDHGNVTVERIQQVADSLVGRGVAAFLSMPKSMSSSFSRWHQVDLQVNYNVASANRARSRQTEILVSFGRPSVTGVRT